MKIKLYISFLFLVLFTSCITEYNASGVEEQSGLLVVEGFITNDTTVIKLKRSVGLSEDLNSATVVGDAVVYVETDKGTTYRTSMAYSGVYKILTGQLDANTKYRLKIQHSGNEYESEYQLPVSTSQIDSIFITKEAEGKPVDICVATHGSDDQSRYYFWSFEEDWEIHAYFYASYYYDEELKKWMDYQDFGDGYSPLYYCWKSDRSRWFYLGSSDKLSSNVISRKVLVSKPPSDSRFQYLYHIKLKQNMISKQAFEYFSNLQKNIEESESIFPPVPSEMKGNLRCINNPSIPVIGYVDVSQTVEKKVFFESKPDIYEPPYGSCKSYTAAQVIDQFGEDALGNVFKVYSGDPLSPAYAMEVCFDCKLSGTKKKPSFWPNDH